MPLELQTQNDAHLHLDATLDIGVCDEVCVPMSAHLKATLDPAVVGANTDMIKVALGDRPNTLPKATCKATPIEDGMTLRVNVSLPALSTNEHAVLELPDKTIWVSEAELTRDGNTLSIQSDFVPEDAVPFALSRSDVTISVFGNGKAFERTGCSGS